MWNVIRLRRFIGSRSGFGGHTLLRHDSLWRYLRLQLGQDRLFLGRYLDIGRELLAGYRLSG